MTFTHTQRYRGGKTLKLVLFYSFKPRYLYLNTEEHVKMSGYIYYIFIAPQDLFN